MASRLGLDIGTNSIGWALLETDGAGQPIRLKKAGVRIFSDGRNPKNGEPLAVKRRIARGARRNRDRGLRRKADLMSALISLGLMPDEPSDRKAMEAVDPYELRARALDERLSPHELGRALFHLGQRRGFKSNRKTDSDDADAKGVVKSAISDLQSRIDKSKARTLGEYLHRRLKKRKRARSQYTDRAMYEREFAAVIEAQRGHHAELTDEAVERLRWTIFRQRPLRPVSPGRCTLNPDEQRAPWGLLLSQHFRMYQELNNLRILNLAHESIPLSRDQRDAIFEKLESKPSVTFKAIRKLLKLEKNESLNLEAENRKGLLGNQTNAVLSNEKGLGASWMAMDPSLRDKIVHALIEEESEDVLAEKARADWNLDRETADRLAQIVLPRGYAKLGVTAMSQIVPILREQGLSYAEAAAEAGFHHSDFRPDELLEKFPYYGEILERHVSFGSGDPEDSVEDRYGKIANPTVHVALNQLRKLCNAIAQEFGRPDEVVVEFARDLKLSEKRKAEEREQNAKNRATNERINSELIKLNQTPHYDNRQKWKLWEELSSSPMERRCVFSGRQISLSMLYTNQVHVEHILPFSRTYDDSMGNKTLAMDKANQDKGGRSPHEAFGSGAVPGYDWAEIQERSASLPRNKRWRFASDAMQKNDDEGGFLARQLTDTAYIARISREYLSYLSPDVRAVPGRLTALMRRKWGLNGVLSADPVKNRDDHRTHAIDAIVVACTDRGILARTSSANEGARERVLIPEPHGWESFRRDVESSILGIIVSHKPDHGSRFGGGTSGQLHDDTAYGIASGPDQKGYYELGYRKALAELSPSEVGKVKDKTLRLRIQEYLDSHSEEFKTHKKAIASFSAESGVRSVRIEVAMSEPVLISDAAGSVYKAFRGNSNEYLNVYECDNGKWHGEVVSTYEAHASGSGLKKKPVAKPKMRLHKNDMVAMGEGEARAIYRLAVMSRSVTFCEHFEAGKLRDRDKDPSDPFSYLRLSVGRFKEVGLRRVAIDCLGRILDPGPLG